MKWVFRLPIIVMLLAALAMPFFLKEKNGRPAFEAPDMGAITEFSPTELFTSKPEEKSIVSDSTHVYKWQDENGQWHYGDKAPQNQASRSLQTVELDPNTNLIQSLKLPEDKDDQEVTNNKAKELTAEMTSPDEDMFSLERLQNVMKDAQLAADAMESRNDVLKKIAGDK